MSVSDLTGTLLFLKVQILEETVRSLVVLNCISYMNYPVFGARGLILFVFPPPLFRLLQEVTERKKGKERK